MKLPQEKNLAEKQENINENIVRKYIQKEKDFTEKQINENYNLPFYYDYRYFLLFMCII